jgi:chemotaxis protein CheC
LLQHDKFLGIKNEGCKNNTYMFQLSELQNDTLLELFNEGAGQAAAAISQIVHEKIAISVPSVTFQTKTDVARALGSAELRRICSIAQDYHGAFNTKAILMFAKDKSLEIVRLMVWESVTMEELSEMEEEAISEIGNIILNSCTGKLADISGRELHGSLPEYRVGTSDRILGTSDNQSNVFALTLKIEFNIEKFLIEGFVTFMLDMAAIRDLQATLEHYSIGLTS